LDTLIQETKCQVSGVLRHPNQIGGPDLILKMDPTDKKLGVIRDNLDEFDC
jgi:hypothetical protein